MSLRYLGGYVSPSYNPLAANVGPGVNVAQTEGVYTTQAALESLSAGQWCTDPNFKQTTLLLQADNALNTSQNNTFLDSSVNGLIITRSGNPTQGSLSPFSAQPGYWSGYFGGTGYYATTPFQSLPTTTSTFTIEAWIYQTAYPVAQGGPVQPSLVGDQNPTGPGANWMFGVLSTGLLSFWWNDTGTKACVGNTVTPLNTWIHVAVSVSANAIKLFVNGVLQTLTGNTTLGNRGTDQGRTTIGQYAGTNSYIYGYVSNLRIVTGTALYSTSFTPSTTPLTAISGTTLLTLQNNNTFKDASTNNRTITPTLAAGRPFSLVAPQYAYSPGILATNSGYFNGTGNLAIASSANLAPGEVFTFETWVYFTSAPNGWVFYELTTNTAFQCGFNSTTSWGVASRGTAWLLTTTTLPITNQWNHIVVSRGGTGTNQTSLFLNGVRVANGTVSAAFTTTGALQIGTYSIGYLSNLRLVQGVDVYGYTNTTITVPTAPLTVIPNTQLLTCQATTFIDSSPNNFTITISGAPVVQAVSPFASNFPIGPNVTGGSGYFDGTGDYLSFPNSAGFAFGTAAWTIEFWVYPISVANRASFVDTRSVDSSNFGLNIYSNPSSGTIGLQTGSSIVFTSSATLKTNSWNYVAITSTGTSATLYLDGVSVNTGTYSQNLTDQLLRVGATTSSIGSYLNGYMSGLRITKGAVLSISVPTLPPTTTVSSGTVSALLNYTNASIVDNSLKTVAETVGNAQVSTSVTKFGSGSMAFDGTGDWLLLPDSPALQMGLGDFTVEGWVYLTATGTARGLISKGTATTGWSVNITSTNFLQASYTSTNLTGTIPLVANTWYHFAMVRFSSSVGNIKLYLNGVLAASSATAITTDFIQTNPLYVGANRVAGEPMLGYMDDVRITKMARYKDSFIPPTIAFARQ